MKFPTFHPFSNPKVMELMGRLTSRSTLFCIGFFIVGHVMFWYGKLDKSGYNMFMGTLLAAVLGHAAQENYFNGNGKSSDSTVVVDSTTVVTK